MPPPWLWNLRKLCLQLYWGRGVTWRGWVPASCCWWRSRWSQAWSCSRSPPPSSSPRLTSPGPRCSTTRGKHGSDVWRCFPSRKCYMGSFHEIGMLVHKIKTFHYSQLGLQWSLRVKLLVDNCILTNCILTNLYWYGDSAVYLDMGTSWYFSWKLNYFGVFEWKEGSNRYPLLCPDCGMLKRPYFHFGTAK